MDVVTFYRRNFKLDKTVVEKQNILLFHYLG